MPASPQEKLAQSFQTQLASQQAQWVSFANITLESSLKLLELSWQVTKDSLEDSAQATQQLLATKSPQELLKFDSEKIRDNFSRMMNYAGAVTTVASNMQNELRKATQAQFGEAFGKTSTLIGQPAQASAVGAQNPFELMKTAMENARVGYEQWAETTKKVAETMGANLNVSGESPTAKKRNGAK